MKRVWIVGFTIAILSVFSTGLACRPHIQQAGSGMHTTTSTRTENDERTIPTPSAPAGPAAYRDSGTTGKTKLQNKR